MYISSILQLYHSRYHNIHIITKPQILKFINKIIPSIIGNNISIIISIINIIVTIIINYSEVY